MPYRTNETLNEILNYCIISLGNPSSNEYSIYLSKALPSHILNIRKVPPFDKDGGMNLLIWMGWGIKMISRLLMI